MKIANLNGKQVITSDAQVLGDPPHVCTQVAGSESLFPEVAHEGEKRLLDKVLGGFESPRPVFGHRPGPGGDLFHRLGPIGQQACDQPSVFVGGLARCWRRPVLADASTAKTLVEDLP